MDFRKVLSDKRIAVSTPENVIDKNGNCHFGTFDKEFQNMDFLGVDKPTALPNFLNRLRLTVWEAAEINFDKIVLLTAVCDMGIIGTILTVVYDKRTKKCTFWQDMLPGPEVSVCKTLLHGDETSSKSKKVRVKIINNFENGKAIVSGFSSNKKSTVDYRVKLNRVSKPSIVNIPFGANRPLYSQKDLFSVEGYIEFNGERFIADSASTAIIDDHRGYYPRVSHYDWVTTLGQKDIDGNKEYFGINLTRNQSINQTDYNENLIWFEGRSTLLTPVRFYHENPNCWHVKDEYGMVDLTFDIGDEFTMYIPLKIVDMDYHITFGELKGYVCDPDGKKYILDGMTGIGEDKSLTF